MIMIERETGKGNDRDDPLSGSVTLICIFRTVVILMGCMTLCTVTGICAYLFSSGRQVNELAYGTNIIKIEEEFDAPYMDYGNNNIKKNVKVRNTGTVPCYIRVYLGLSEGAQSQEWMFSADGKTYYSIEEYRSNMPAGNWYYDETDGYFYYMNILQPGDISEALIDSVECCYEYWNGAMDIYVYAESVQIRDENGCLYYGDRPWRTAWNI